MDITAKVRVNENAESNIKAFATITINGCFAVSGIKVVETSEGETFVAMPNYKTKDGNYHDSAFPVKAEVRNQIINAVMEAYNNPEKEHTEMQVKGLKVAATLRVVDHLGEKIKAAGEIRLSDGFVVSGVKIFEGNNGLFVAMPTQKGKDDKYYDIAYPVTAEFRKVVNDKIMEAYNKMLSQKSIGNIEYKELMKKGDLSYRKFKNTDISSKIIKKISDAGFEFSGRIKDDGITICFSVDKEKEIDKLIKSVKNPKR